MLIPIKSVSGVAPNTTTIFDLPVGKYRYKHLILTAGLTSAGSGNAPALTSIDKIRINYLGGIQRTFTATELNVINTENGAEFANVLAQGGANGTGRRRLPIYFHEPWRNLGDAHALSWCTDFFRKGDLFTLEVDNVSNNVLTLLAEVDEVRSGAPHPIIKWNRHSFAASGTPLADITKLDQRDDYAQFDIFDTTNGETVEAVRIVQDSTKEIFNVSKGENNSYLTNKGMNPAAGSFCIPFDINDNLRDRIRAANLNMTVTPSASAAGNLPIVSQRFGLPE